MFKNYQQYMNYRSSSPQADAYKKPVSTYNTPTADHSHTVKPSGSDHCTAKLDSSVQSNAFDKQSCPISGVQTNTFDELSCPISSVQSNTFHKQSCPISGVQTNTFDKLSSQALESINVPPSEPFDTENFYGSIQQVLHENIGRCVTCEFLVGTTITTTKSGIIYYVGRTYLILYSPTTTEYTLCDIFSVKFVTFVAISNCLN